MTPAELWRFLPLGYALTVAVEIPILLVGLSRRHSRQERLLAGLWLTACTYPIVVLVLPLWMIGASRGTYLAVAETMAPLTECLLFWLAYGTAADTCRKSMWRDFSAIILANLASFALGESLRWSGFWREALGG